MTAHPVPPAAAVLLAAGFSTRMGMFKPLLPFGDTTVLGHVIRLWQNAGVRSLVVVSGHRADEVEAEAERWSCLHGRNNDPARGMFSSIVTGLAFCLERFPKAQWLGVHPADIPLVAPATLDRLLRACAKTSAVLVKPVFAGRNGHPPLVRISAVPGILANDGSDGLRGVLKPLALERVVVDDANINRDLDFRADYEEGLRLLALSMSSGRTGGGR